MKAAWVDGEADVNKLKLIHPITKKVTKYVLGFTKFDFVARGCKQTYGYGIIGKLLDNKDTEEEARKAVESKLKSLGFDLDILQT